MEKRNKPKTKPSPTADPAQLLFPSLTARPTLSLFPARGPARLAHPATVQRSAQLAPRSPQPSASHLACVHAVPLTSRARLSAPAVTRRPRPPRAADAPTPLVIPFLSPLVFLAALPALLRPARFASVPWTKSCLSTSRARWLVAQRPYPSRSFHTEPFHDPLLAHRVNPAIFAGFPTMARTPRSWLHP